MSLNQSEFQFSLFYLSVDVFVDLELGDSIKHDILKTSLLLLSSLMTNFPDHGLRELDH